MVVFLNFKCDLINSNLEFISVYTVVDKVFARQEISRVFRMFVFGWKHKILIK